MKSQSLKRKLKSTAGIPEPHAVRLHRAISWLACAEEHEKDPDVQFLGLWISFNACYSMDPGGIITLSERKRLHDFIVLLVTHDPEQRLFNLFWNTYSGPVRMLIENKYVFRPFWDFHRGEVNEWEEVFRKSVLQAHQSLADHNVSALLDVVLDRLYTLRNQLIHGGATYRSKVNRKQVQDGCKMLNMLVPIIIDVMINESDTDWGDIFYPVIS